MGPLGNAARIFREAGGRVGTNCLMRDMDLLVLATDSRRLEVVVDGLPLFRVCQLAVVRCIAMAQLMTVHPTGTVWFFRLLEEERNAVIQSW